MAVTPETEIKLLTVPFDSSYKHILDFNDSDEQTDYFRKKVNFTFDFFTYQREERSMKVPINLDKILNCNYVMYQNSNFNRRWFFAFILEKRYINPETTELIIVQDVWQTWQFDIEFKPSFIERMHTNRWYNGSPVINTVDEGLNYGSEYDIVSIDRFHPSDDIFFLVIVTKQTLKEMEYDPTYNGIMQPLVFYVQPFKLDGTVPPVKIGGVTHPAINLETLLQMLYLSENAQSNIVSLYITDYIGVDIGFNGTVNLDGAEFESQLFPQADTPIIKVKTIKQYETKSKTYTDKYSGFSSVTESKLMMYPYMLTMLSDGKGNQIVYKNEYINSPDLTVICRGSLGTSNKVAYSVHGYLQSLTEPNGHVTNLKNAVINNESNDVPIITDLLSAYLQGNKNTIALTKAQTEFNQDIQLATGITNTVQSAGAGAIAGATTGGIAGGVLGGIVGGTENALNTYSTYQNYQYQLQGELAKQKDIANTPPSISGLGNNSYFDYGNNITGIYIIKKQIKQEYMNKLTDFFRMYGYKVNKVETPNFKSREHFNYIKTIGCNIQSMIANNDINQIKAIFDNGVTVWHVDDIANYFLENSEV
jgi:hypothetical protein